ncbi:class I SAM-dependent DNA methyltransferase [Mycoplasmopsis arginini]|uniref:class I SAM-dependent DNA methyltransferase n=1 Tax=Mycoplasmopsis arginini TaxID=2094 RepID=UPI00227B5176|nr:class I SAM-dependent DNA methyltransferase [Mycoplasmopsis arginini]MCY2902853.1 SAM-dependent DNA methyltransferase [Mycoplasmopsis arginini QMP CG1-2758]MDI3350285.1 SAM-dependent DNA methyltransferase [Mycoplasmopsis arginini]MDI3350920.1 SAM-dependent DNA methyltransferase [Mycoplasmopsis arginini]MDI3352523.1 SAM-dependent DNA methyltransferase [Mycoplasmopsis arginini]
MAVSNLVKRIQDIMRNDAGVDGDAQRISQMTWMFFLKVYDAKEEEWEFFNEDYKSLIPEELKWRNWAIDDKSNNVITGEKLLDLVNNKVFPTLKNLEINEDTPLKQRIIRYVFEDAQNYMKDGVLLRQVINVINEIDFSEYKERHEFGEIYETILKSLQSAGNAGEFYTPRAVTDFMVQMIKPQLGEKVADFACGTGGFLTSTLKYLEPQKKNEEDVDKYNTTIYGIEKKPMPYLLCITNMLLHDVDEPKIYHANSLEKNVRDYKENDKFDVILMNPPYGGSEKDAVKNNFPAELRSSETADLFMDVIMFRLKKNGRCAVIIPDGFLFGEDNAKVAIKTKLMNEFNLHTIVRMPHSVFAPYTSITTNILFFDNSHPTEETWVYRMDMPDGYKNFSKTKPILLDHFKPVVEWWNNREEITIDEFHKAKKYSKKEIEELHYNLDLCGYPHIEDEILEPKELIQQFREKRESYNAEMEITLAKILEILDEDN